MPSKFTTAFASLVVLVGAWLLAAALVNSQSLRFDFPFCFLFSVPFADLFSFSFLFFFLFFFCGALQNELSPHRARWPRQAVRHTESSDEQRLPRWHRQCDGWCQSPELSHHFQRRLPAAAWRHDPQQKVPQRFVLELRSIRESVVSGVIGTQNTRCVYLRTDCCNLSVRCNSDTDLVETVECSLVRHATLCSLSYLALLPFFSTSDQRSCQHSSHCKFI